MAVQAVEVVSVSSVITDNQVKPKHYAQAGAPLCLVVDPLDQRARLFSGRERRGTGHEECVVFGEPIDLPQPWGLALETAEFAA